MEGPTPVSALLHAATMVTAGIFLMIKCSCFYEYTNILMYLIIFIGSLTSFFSATVGLFQNDIKKIIAYSTCSQLGYMLISSGFSHYSVSLFHLLNHGFFKALLFLGSGIIIHFYNNEQDSRVMGGFSEFYISLYLILLVGTFSLCGFPFFSGFFSKDLILETSNLLYSITGNFVKLLQYIAAFFTCLYGLRNNNLVFFVFFNSFYNIFI
jgi:NADH-ubiquinone oxidoreductase chain 5